MGRRAHRPDLSQRKQVEAMAAYGIPTTDIARVIGVDPKTLRKCYRDELDLGQTKANAQVAGFLFAAARNGNVTAQIFWLKTRARWNSDEQVQESDFVPLAERIKTYTRDDGSRPARATLVADSVSKVQFPEVP